MIIQIPMGQAIIILDLLETTLHIPIEEDIQGLVHQVLYKAEVLAHPVQAHLAVDLEEAQAVDLEAEAR
tara:strand:+ start:79 stop:285 length:207 start_codon:yes stop_codon:yes gene_type:complete